ncbi:MAG TPA: CBS domain-containing protein [Thermoanaerobaculia bacterium]
MLIRDVMTVAPVCCAPSETLDNVARLMLEHDCGEIPVCDGVQLVGVITDRDITCRAVARGLSPMDVPVEEVMTRNVFSIPDDAKIDEALELMNETLVRRLPVVDAGGYVVGIISQADLIAKVPTLKVARLMRSVSQRTRRYSSNH